MTEDIYQRCLNILNIVIQKAREEIRLTTQLPIQRPVFNYDDCDFFEVGNCDL